MYVQPTEPRSIGGVLDNIFALYRVSLGPVLVLSVIAAVMGAVPAIYMSVTAGTDPTAILSMFSDPSYWLILLLLMVIGIVVQIAALVRIHGVATNQSVSVAEALTIGGRRAVRCFFALILYGIIFVGGFFLLVIPGIFLMLALSFFTVFIAIENARVLQSLKSSFALTKGHWWRTFAIFLIVFIMLIVLVIVISLIGGLMAVFSADLTTVQIVSQGVSAISNVFLYPLFYAAYLSIYYDLKLRSEGADLSRRVESLA